MNAHPVLRRGVLNLIGSGAFLLPVLPLAAQDAVELKPELKTGKKYTIEQQQKVTSTITMGDATVETKMDMAQTMSMAVKALEGSGNREISMSVDGVKAKMNMLGQEMSYDSADPANANPLLGTALGQMVGKDFQVVIDEKNEVVEVKGFDELTAGGAANPLQGAALSDEMMTQMLEGLSGKRGFPDKPVKVGDTWTESFSMPVPQIGELKVEAAYKYEGKATPPDGAKELDKISFTGTMKMASDTTATGPSGVGIRIGDSTMEGTVFFDQGEAFVSYSTTEVAMNMQVDNGEQTMDVPSKQTITVRLKSVEDSK